MTCKTFLSPQGLVEEQRHFREHRVDELVQPEVDRDFQMRILGRFATLSVQSSFPSHKVRSGLIDVEDRFSELVVQGHLRLRQKQLMQDEELSIDVGLDVSQLWMRHLRVHLAFNLVQKFDQFYGYQVGLRGRKRAIETHHLNVRLDNVGRIQNELRKVLSFLSSRQREGRGFRMQFERL